MTIQRTGTSQTRRRTVGLAVLIALVLTSVARTGAHPASETSVVIALQNRKTIEVALASNASALVTKLELLSGTALSAPSGSREALAARLTSLGATLADHSFLTIDGVRLPTRPGTAVVDERGLATMHLTGQLNEEVRGTLAWSSDLMYGSYPLVIRRSDGQETITWIDGRASSGTIPLDHLAEPVSIGSGLLLGFTHIVPKGLDHILFVLGLFLLSPAVPRWPRTRNQEPGTRNPAPNGFSHLIWQVSAFTVAHTFTLGLSLYGVVQAPDDVIEPLIALSVAYVGVENLLTSRLHPWRVIVVFAFGLLHGLGFAGAISELPYSQADLLGMLVSFNAGVELGQLAVIAAAAIVMRIVLSSRQSWQRPATQVASAGVGMMGLLWTIERIGM